MFTSIKKNRQQIFVIDGHANNVFKNSEIINKVLKCFKIKNKIKFNNKKTFYSPNIQVSRCKKLQKWGWKPKVNLDQGIKKYTT